MPFPHTVEKHSLSFIGFLDGQENHEAFKLCDAEVEERNFLLVNQGFFILNFIWCCSIDSEDPWHRSNSSITEYQELVGDF